jgi:hypothetical protein
MSATVTVGHGSRDRWQSRSVTLPAADLFAVACSKCGAEPSQRCRGQLGPLPPGKSHLSRADAATAQAGAR